MYAASSSVVVVAVMAATLADSVTLQGEAARVQALRPRPLQVMALCIWAPTSVAPFACPLGCVAFLDSSPVWAASPSNRLMPVGWLVP